jgi:hypothetical protein
VAPDRLAALAERPASGYTNLDPGGPRSGSHNRRWMVRVNLPGTIGLPSRGHPMAFDLIMNRKYLVGTVFPLFLAKDEGAEDYFELHLDIEKRVGDSVSLAPG